MPPELEDWTQWKATCALGLCAAGTRAALQEFAHSRFCRYMASYASVVQNAGAGSLTPSPGESWHRFETHLRLHNTREGKSYKEWIFARQALRESTLLDCIQGGATLLMRDVVREYLRRETSPANMVRLEAPLAAGAGGTDGSALTLEDLLPGAADTRDEVSEKEIRDMADAAAMPVFDAIPRRARVALLARELGLSLAHPEVVAAAGCGKSVLFTTYRKTLESLAGAVRERHPGLDRATLAELCIRLFETVRHTAVVWGRSEKDCGHLFCCCIGAAATAISDGPNQP